MHKFTTRIILAAPSLFAFAAEQEALEYYEHSCNLAQAEIDAAVNEMYADEVQRSSSSGAQRTTNCQVLCPQCKANWLLQTDGGRVFVCSCNFRFNAQHDGVTPEYLQQRLSESYQQHRSACQHEPVFSVQNQFGAEVLCIECQACRHFAVVV